MAHRQVNLTKRIETPQGWRYCPVVFSANGRVKPDLVLVNGKEERHTEGAYYLDWYQNSTRIRVSVGKDANDANNRRLRKEAEFQAIISGVTVVPEDRENSKRPTLAAASADYLEEIKITRTPGTLTCYSLALRYFNESCKKTYLDEINRSDLLQFLKYLREVKHVCDRTQYNQFEHVVTFLKSFGVEKLMKKRDWPRYVLQEPESYDDEQLDKFFAACDAEERDYFMFYLMTGFRRKEVIYCTWGDVDLRAGTVRVTAKPEYGFRPKDWENRTVPIPDALVQLLRQRMKRNGSEGFVFATKNGTPRKHRTQVLELCKAVAERAELDPDDFWLHKFRATFATRHLQSGVDLRTVQSWLGHKDLESTMRYLTPAKGKGIRAKVNGTFAAMAGGKR